jgi:hypothetical protein
MLPANEACLRVGALCHGTFVSSMDVFLHPRLNRVFFLLPRWTADAASPISTRLPHARIQRLLPILGDLFDFLDLHRAGLLAVEILRCPLEEIAWMPPFLSALRAIFDLG